MKSENKNELNENWTTLSNHMQAKIRGREQNISYLHTKAGFILATIALVAQLLPSNEFLSNSQTCLIKIAALSLMIAFITALISLFINKSTTAPDGKQMGKTLLDEPGIGKTEFDKWMAESYQAAYEQFEETYKNKDNLIRLSAIFATIALGIILYLRII